MFNSFIFISMWSLVGLANAYDEQTTLDMNPIKVGNHSYYVKGMSGTATRENQGFMSNAGFVVTKTGVVVFDALATPELARILISEISKITTLPIKRLIVSHYHADHIYGLQVVKALGTEIWAHIDGQAYLGSDESVLRLQQRRETLKPWVDDDTKLVPADVWLDGDTSFEMGGLHFELGHVGPAHSPEDLIMMVKEDGVLYSGDLVFKGRVPFVGNADSRMWLEALEKLINFNPKIMVPGHGSASSTPVADLRLTSDYLEYVRFSMGNAVRDFVDFDDAYARTDWSKFSNMPAYLEANRANAYNTYLLMERESLNH